MCDGVTVNTMSYDNYGNITAKNGIAYTYDGTWKDLLIAYNGQSITYDAQGNPTSYLGHTLTWEKGRQLKSYDTNTYTYNANGIRTSKTVGGVKHTYILDGAKVLYEKWGDNVLSTLWDNEDSLCGIRYADESYFFLKNLQGDIIAITDKHGAVVARYIYDAWGVCTIVSDTSTIGIATINPFRYRGYYYDAEIGMYYLQSRYYNPALGRFVNVDTAEYIMISANDIGRNLFCYCCNSAPNFSDHEGAFAISASLALIVGGSLVLILLLWWISRDYFKNLWNESIADIASSIADYISNSRYMSYSALIALLAIIDFSAISRANSKITAKIKLDSKNRYWTATLRKNYVDIGRAISYGTAVKEVTFGRNVFTVTRAEAKAVAKAAYSNKTPVGPEIDGGKENVMGYYYHYHVYNRKNKAHVFFLFW